MVILLLRWCFRLLPRQEWRELGDMKKEDAQERYNALASLLLAGRPIPSPASAPTLSAMNSMPEVSTSLLAVSDNEESEDGTYESDYKADPFTPTLTPSSRLDKPRPLKGLRMGSLARSLVTDIKVIEDSVHRQSAVLESVTDKITALYSEEEESRASDLANESMMKATRRQAKQLQELLAQKRLEHSMRVSHARYFLSGGCISYFRRKITEEITEKKLEETEVVRDLFSLDSPPGTIGCPDANSKESFSAVSPWCVDQ